MRGIPPRKSIVASRGIRSKRLGIHGDTHVAVGTFLDHAKHHLVRSGQEREDHMLDAVRFDDFAKIPTRTEHRERRPLLSNVS